jgi:hypothetical protein
MARREQRSVGKKVECTCDVIARFILFPTTGVMRSEIVPLCMSPDCPTGFGNIVLAEQEAAEYKAYLNGTVVHGDEY